MTDILLVMPPVSEAVQFPYLALPQLTAAWSAQGYTVRCADLNLAYRNAVLREDAGDRALREDTASPAEAKEIYRSVSERYRHRHGDRLLARSRDRSVASVQAMAIRATGRYVAERATADHWILREPLPLADLEGQVRASGESWSARWCDRRLRELLAEHRPRVLALTVPFFSQVIPVLTLAGLLKAAGDDVPVMVGGPTVQMWAGLLRARVPAARAIDHWCPGHGETYLRRVLPRGPVRPAPKRAAPRAFTGTGLADGFRINEQEPPDFAQFDLADYSNEAHQFPYRLTLGCYWGRCTFCSYGNRYHDARAFQQVTPERAADHLVLLADRLGVTDVAIADENTGLRHLIRVMSAVRRRGARLTFRVRARLEPDLADIAFCQRLRELGCLQISAGFETAHQGLLDTVRKGQRATEAEQAVTHLVAAGITTNLSFMDGYAHPAAAQGFETTVAAIRRNAATMGLDTMQLLVAEPGSHLWADRWSAPDGDEYLVTNDGLAFAAGRVGAPPADPATAEEARQRLLRMTVEAVPDAERASRPDLSEAVRMGNPADPMPLRAWPRAGVALESVRHRRVLADVAWPRLAAVPPEASHAADGALEAADPQTHHWLTRMLAKRLLVVDPEEAEIS